MGSPACGTRTVGTRPSGCSASAWPAGDRGPAAPTLDISLYFHENGNMDEKAAVTALAALAQEARLRVFRALVGAGLQGMTPGALAAMLDVPASTLSFHLKELVHAGLVTAERESRNLFYRPDLARMSALLGFLTDHCCQGQPCGDAAQAACRPSLATSKRSA